MTRNLFFCSVACGKTHTRTSRPPRACKNCGSAIPFDPDNHARKFCSRSCSATFNNAARVKARLCEQCGATLGKGANRYCTQECHVTARKEQFIRAWLAGEVSGTTPKGYVASPVVHWIRGLRGEGCWECGWSVRHPITGRVPTQVDHIDGDAMNNRPGNLRLLCPNCHSLTETFGNIGGRRSTRTWRYSGKADAASTVALNTPINLCTDDLSAPSGTLAT